MTIFLIHVPQKLLLEVIVVREIKQDYSDAEKEGDAVPGLETDLGAGALSTKIVRNYKTQMQSAFWLMTQSGKIIRSVIDTNAETMRPKPTKEWNYNLVGAGGSRTLCLKVELLLEVEPVDIYFG